MTSTRLDKEVLTTEQSLMYNKMKQSPIKVLQIGEGNFLRGFFDWMLYESRKQGLYDGSIAVVQPRPTGKPNIEALSAQDGIYTLVTRGLENNVPTERVDQITVFSTAFDPYEHWDKFIALAELPELKIVVSNTTEAGLTYRPEQWKEGEPIASYPGKLTALLYYRFKAFQGDPERGFICLPCELLERNGDTLRECILRYCEDWQLPAEFRDWIVNHNLFLNSLVDRIVTGYPKQEQADAWFDEWGYRDPMLTTAEPYHLWAIEGDPSLDRNLPLAAAGLNVLWVEDLKPFQVRKVSILNGAHTFMALYGLLQGVQEVRLAMEDSHISKLIKRTIQTEIIPSLPYDSADLQQYAEQVYERFLNPFIQHRLTDIAMNSLSKFRTRLLPAIQYYLQNEQSALLPQGLATVFAALIRYYQVQKVEAGFQGESFTGEFYILRDDPDLLDQIANIWSSYSDFSRDYSSISLHQAVAQILQLEALWGFNIHVSNPNLAEQLTAIMMRWEESSNE
ncbi:MAG TPA: tagaturonate reductase [Candidatus Paenibacillus intestinavium]|nr:tagaturonate reductase [Candidatus Paenibacillus intestinavium]